MKRIRKSCPKGWQKSIKRCPDCQRKPAVIFGDKDGTSMCEEHWVAWGENILFMNGKFSVEG